MLDDQGIRFDWDDLLDFVEGGKVVPIIGAELLEVECDGSRVSLYQYVARKLAELLLPGEKLPADATLNEVIYRYTATPGRQREDVYPKISRIMRATQFAPPEVLRQLARITPFDLFVTLTFDSLLAAAIDEARPDGEKTLELAYSPPPGNADDLSAPRTALRQPVVYHLFGKVSAAPEYVITDECILEFLYSVQSASRRPNRLLDELKGSHLLFLGCNFSDWFARFFIRIAKSKQLSLARGETEVLVDSMVAGDGSLVMFLEHFSHRTRIMPGGAADFVAELERRYQARAAAAPVAATPARLSATAAFQDEMAPGAVFISYASEDRDAAYLLHDSLQEARVESWFDKTRLGAGDTFDRRIRKGIKECSCFIPLISAASTSRQKGYFIAEWTWAQEEAAFVAEGIPFIMPVVIDGTPDYTDGVPESFRKLHWRRLAGGRATPGFADELKQLVQNRRKRNRAP